MENLILQEPETTQDFWWLLMQNLWWLLIIVTLWLLIRELVCWYYKINVRIKLIEKQNELFEKQNELLQQIVKNTNDKALLNPKLNIADETSLNDPEALNKLLKNLDDSNP